MTDPEKVIGDLDNYEYAKAMGKIFSECRGITLTDAIARLKAPLSPEEVVERLQVIECEERAGVDRNDAYLGSIQDLISDITKESPFPNINNDIKKLIYRYQTEPFFNRFVKQLKYWIRDNGVSIDNLKDAIRFLEYDEKTNPEYWKSS